MQIARVGSGGRAPSKPEAEFTIAGGPGQSREVREATLPPGEYEMVAVMARRRGGSSWVATVDRRPLVVPHLTAAVLEASPVVLGEAAEAAPEPGVPRPFVFGRTNLKPAASARFNQGGQLHMALRVYGWKGDEDARPDLTVEYVFQQVFRGGSRFFNKTKPQALNAKTLGKAFDGRDAEVTAGISLSLAAFPPGEFQVTVRVRDSRTQATTVQRATFVVLGAVS